jgi:hypothetical protein
VNSLIKSEINTRAFPLVLASGIDNFENTADLVIIRNYSVAGFD